MFVGARKDLKHSCCVMLMGKLPPIKKKKKAQRLSVVREQKFTF